MRAPIPTLFICGFLLHACNDQGGTVNAQAPVGGNAPRWKEGTDYTVLERLRVRDEQGYVQPMEAFSVLVPKGWKTEGAVVWKDLNSCAGEMLAVRMTTASPDGAIRYTSLPLHTWGSASDPMMLQSMQMQMQYGGCEVGQPMEAADYLRKVLIPREIEGASVVDIKVNSDVVRELESRNAKYKAAVQQYGGSAEIYPSAIIATLKWPNGEEGIALCTVVNMITTTQDPYTGSFQQLSTSVSSERSWVRFPAERRAEAEQLLVTLRSSFRTNPEWQRNVDDLFARIRDQRDRNHAQVMAELEQQKRMNAAAHQHRMANIQAQGAANTAAHEQRMSNMDRNMRSWENQQSSQDRLHTSFVKTIREVETYRDGSGTVELSSGYDQAWSRGDGTYILSNKPGFDPSSVFQDQNWQQMQLVK